MSTPAIQDDTTQGLVVELANLGGLSLRSERTLFALVGSLAGLVPGVAGQWLDVPANVQLVALAMSGLIIASHLIGKSIHHAAVEGGNASVKNSLIYQAAQAKAPLAVDSPADVVGTITATTTPPMPSWATAPVVVPAADATVGAGLQVVDATVTDAPATDTPAAAPATAPATEPVAPAVL